MNKGVVIFSLLLIIAAGVAAGVILYKKKKEGYGGPVKVINRIPFTDCISICDQYYERCLRDFSDTDPSWCHRRFKQACPSECFYSNHHRQ